MSSRHDATFTLYDMFTRIWTTKDCLTYLDTLAVHFHNRAAEYVDFLCLIKDWYNGKVPSTDMVLLSSVLLRNQPRLLRDLNCILKRPGEEVRIICSVDSPQVECLVAIYAQRIFSRDAVIHLIPRSPDSSRSDLELSTYASPSLPCVWSTKELDPENHSHIHSVDPRWAPFVMELLQVKLETTFTPVHRKKLVQSLQLLNKIHGALPPSIFVHDVSREGSHAVTGGGFADIWKGWRNGKLVCLKVLRFFTGSPEDREKLFKDLSNEVLLWKQLRHERILPLYGVSMELFQPSYCIVSPWMRNGDIGSFLRTSNESRFDKKLFLIREIAEGLSYLHGLDPPIVHGDIKGSNILISDDFHCCLADFGLSFIETQSTNISESTHDRGSIQWLAPELMDPDAVPTQTGYSKTRDIYAFGCTVVEVLTGRPPFPEYKMPLHVMIQVLKGNRPPRPRECSEELWTLIQRCWSERILDRPPASAVFDRLSSLASPRPIYPSIINNVTSSLPSHYKFPPIRACRRPPESLSSQNSLNTLPAVHEVTLEGYSDGFAVSGTTVMPNSITWDDADLLDAWKEYQLRQSANPILFV